MSLMNNATSLNFIERNNMKQHNYAVDLPTPGRANFQNALHFVAANNKWKQLSFNSNKQFFRFKLITDSKEIRENHSYDFKPGFYYWTSNSMSDTNFEYITIDQAIRLLETIDQNEFFGTLVDGQPLGKVNSTTFKIACRQIRIADYETLKTLMKKYDIDTLEIGSNGDNFVFNEKHNQIIDKFLKTKGR